MSFNLYGEIHITASNLIRPALFGHLLSLNGWYMPPETRLFLAGSSFHVRSTRFSETSKTQFFSWSWDDSSFGCLSMPSPKHQRTRKTESVSMLSYSRHLFRVVSVAQTPHRGNSVTVLDFTNLDSGFSSFRIWDGLDLYACYVVTTHSTLGNLFGPCWQGELVRCYFDLIGLFE